MVAPRISPARGFPCLCSSWMLCWRAQATSLPTRRRQSHAPQLAPAGDTGVTNDKSMLRWSCMHSTLCFSLAHFVPALPAWAMLYCPLTAWAWHLEDSRDKACCQCGVTGATKEMAAQAWSRNQGRAAGVCNQRGGRPGHRQNQGEGGRGMQPEGRPPRPEAESRGGRQGYATRGAAAQAIGRIKGSVAGVCNQRGGRPGLRQNQGEGGRGMQPEGRPPRPS